MKKQYRIKVIDNKYYYPQVKIFFMWRYIIGNCSFWSKPVITAHSVEEALDDIKQYNNPTTKIIKNGYTIIPVKL